MKKLFFLLFFYYAGLSAQPNFLQFISKVNSLADNNIKMFLVDSLMAANQVKGLPLIEDNFAIFLWRGNASKVQLAGDFNNWGSPLYDLSLLSGTNLFYFVKSFENDARLDYKLIVNNNWILDPGNPRTCLGGYGPNSELAMTGYIQPWEITYKPNIKHGALIEDTIKSIIVNRTYKLKIFVPTEYFYTSGKYPVVYFQDGEDYLALGYAKNVIDNLIDSGMVGPFIAVFVQPNNRNDEYAYNLRNLYSRFFAEELVPYIDGNYRTIKNPSQRLILGDSFGGNISALIAFNNPDLFGNCGQQSGAFWPNDYEVQKLFLNNPKKSIKIFSVWGTYESLFSDWRPLKNEMIAKGYQIKWNEYHEGHSWGLWRATLDDMLIYFFPKNINAVKPGNGQFANTTRLVQNYPNPFNPSTVITYQIGAGTYKDEFVQLKVFDLMGREAALLVNGFKQPGEYRINFDASEYKLASGVYYYVIHSGNYFESKKMLYVR